MAPASTSTSRGDELAQRVGREHQEGDRIAHGAVVDGPERPRRGAVREVAEVRAELRRRRGRIGDVRDHPAVRSGELGEGVEQVADAVPIAGDAHLLAGDEHAVEAVLEQSGVAHVADDRVLDAPIAGDRDGSGASVDADDVVAPLLEPQRGAPGATAGVEHPPADVREGFVFDLGPVLVVGEVPLQGRLALLAVVAAVAGLLGELALVVVPDHAAERAGALARGRIHAIWFSHADHFSGSVSVRNDCDASRLRDPARS